MNLRFWYIISQVKISAQTRTELHLAIRRFFARFSKDPVLNKNGVHIRNINVQIYTNKLLWSIHICLQRRSRLQQFYCRRLLKPGIWIQTIQITNTKNADTNTNKQIFLLLSWGAQVLCRWVLQHGNQMQIIQNTNTEKMGTNTKKYTFPLIQIQRTRVQIKINRFFCF